MQECRRTSSRSRSGSRSGRRSRSRGGIWIEPALRPRSRSQGRSRLVPEPSHNIGSRQQNGSRSRSGSRNRRSEEQEREARVAGGDMAAVTVLCPDAQDSREPFRWDTASDGIPLISD